MSLQEKEALLMALQKEIDGMKTSQAAPHTHGAGPQPPVSGGQQNLTPEPNPILSSGATATSQMSTAVSVNGSDARNKNAVSKQTSRQLTPVPIDSRLALAPHLPRARQEPNMYLRSEGCLAPFVDGNKAVKKQRRETQTDQKRLCNFTVGFSGENLFQGDDFARTWDQKLLSWIVSHRKCRVFFTWGWVS
jgi:hypothetical protein